jgi:hypothetical protein
MRTALIFAVLAVASARAEVIDRILAVVNGNVITLSDVAAARDLGLVSFDPAVDPIRTILSDLIDRVLELGEVERYAPPEPGPDAIDREVQAVRSRFATQTAFDQALAGAGMDLSRLRERLRDDLRIRAYLDQRFVALADRRPQLVADWLLGLRRRAELADLYLSEP